MSDRHEPGTLIGIARNPQRWGTGRRLRFLLMSILLRSVLHARSGRQRTIWSAAGMDSLGFLSPRSKRPKKTPKPRCSREPTCVDKRIQLTGATVEDARRTEG